MLIINYAIMLFFNMLIFNYADSSATISLTAINQKIFVLLTC